MFRVVSCHAYLFIYFVSHRVVSKNDRGVT
jgi:hypothetical protein